MNRKIFVVVVALFLFFLLPQGVFSQNMERAARFKNQDPLPLRIYNSSPLYWMKIIVGPKELCVIEPLGKVEVERFGLGVNAGDVNLAVVAILFRDPELTDYVGVTAVYVPKFTTPGMALVWEILDSDMASARNGKFKRPVITSLRNTPEVRKLNPPDDWWADIGGLQIFNAGPRAISLLALLSLSSFKSAEGQPIGLLAQLNTGDSILNNEDLSPGKSVHVPVAKMESFFQVAPTGERVAVILSEFSGDRSQDRVVTLIDFPRESPNLNYVRVMVIFDGKRE